MNVNCNGYKSNNAAISENNVLFLQNQAFRKEMHPMRTYPVKRNNFTLVQDDHHL